MSGPTVGYATLQIIPSAKGFGDAITRETDSALSSAGKSGGEKLGSGFKSSFLPSLKGVGAVVGGLFAADKIKDFFGSAIDEARESQKVSGDTAQVIKSTGAAAHVSASQVADLASAISKKVGIDDEAIQSGENMLLTFTNIRNEVGKGNDIFNQATQAVTDMSVKFGGDAKSSAIQLGKALNDPIRGISALSRVGVTFTQQQRDQIKAMVDSGNTLGAQKVILHELSKEFGGAAAAQATSGAKMKVAFDNLKESIGTALLPVIDKLENFITNRLIPGLYTAAGVVKPMVSDFAALGGAIPTPVLEAAAVAVGVLGTALIAGKVATVLSTAATEAWATITKVASVAGKAFAAAQWLVNAALSANPIGLVVIALATLAAGLVVAYKKSETFRDIVHDAFHVVGSAIDFVKDHWKLFATAFVTLLGGPIAGAIVLLVTHFGDVKHAATTVVSGVTSAFSSMVHFIAGVPGKVASAAVGMFDGIRDAFKSAINTVIGWWDSLVSKLKIPAFHVNTHIPGVGTIGFDGLDIGGGLQIPKLAQGGIATSATLAVIGEGAEPEAVLPLSKLRSLLASGVPSQGGPSGVGAGGNAMLAEMRALRTATETQTTEVAALRSEVRRQTDRHALLTRTGAIR